MRRRRLMLAAIVLAALAPFVVPATQAGKKTKPPPEPANPAIAYTTTDWKLQVVDADGGNATTVPTEATVYASPNWSPDGAHLVFKAVSGHYMLWRVDVDGGNATKLVDPVWRAGVWSPAGEGIAYIHNDMAGTMEIRLIPVNGGTPTTAYTSSHQIHSLTYRYDGTKLAFAVDSAPQVVKVLDLDSGIATTIYTGTIGVDRWEHLDWARTDDILAFRRMNAGIISTYDLDTGAVTELFEGRQPSWSPDDAKLAYQRDGKKSVRGIYVYTFASGSHVKIVKDGRYPDWKR